MKYMNKLESLETAYRKEHADVAIRMIAVIMILKNGKDVQTVAENLCYCTNWVRKWVGRFEVDGLCTLQRSSRQINLKEKNGWYHLKSNVNFVYAYNVAANNRLFYWSKIRHNSHQKDNAPVWHVCKNCTKIPYQSCKHICCS